MICYTHLYSSDMILITLSNWLITHKVSPTRMKVWMTFNCFLFSKIDDSRIKLLHDKTEKINHCVGHKILETLIGCKIQDIVSQHRDLVESTRIVDIDVYPNIRSATDETLKCIDLWTIITQNNWFILKVFVVMQSQVQGSWMCDLYNALSNTEN